MQLGGLLDHDNSIDVNANIAKLFVQELKSIASSQYKASRYKLAIEKNKNTSLGDIHLMDDLHLQSAIVLLQAVISKNNIDKAISHNDLIGYINDLLNEPWEFFLDKDVFGRLFFKLYEECESQKDKFNVNGFIYYNLIKTITPQLIGFVDNDDFTECDDPVIVRIEPQHYPTRYSLLQLLGNVKLHEVKNNKIQNIHAAILDYLDLRVFNDIRYLNYFFNTISEKIYTQTQTSALTEPATNELFLEYKKSKALQQMFYTEVNSDYIIQIFSNKTWRNDRIKSILNKLYRNAYIMSKPDTDIHDINYEKLNNEFSSILLVNT